MTDIYKRLIEGCERLFTQEPTAEVLASNEQPSVQFRKTVIACKNFLSSIPTLEDICPKEPKVEDFEIKLFKGLSRHNEEGYNEALKTFKLGGLFVGEWYKQENYWYCEVGANDKYDTAEIRFGKPTKYVIYMKANVSIAETLSRGVAKLNRNHSAVPEHLAEILPEIFEQLKQDGTNN